MANKKTIALTTEQYNEIIDTMKTGFTGFRLAYIGHIEVNIK